MHPAQPVCQSQIILVFCAFNINDEKRTNSNEFPTDLGGMNIAKLMNINLKNNFR
jgi:hypothetical protein